MRRNSKREIKTSNLEEDVGPGRLPKENHHVITLDVEGGWSQKLFTTYVSNVERKPCISLTEASVKVADARQYLASGKAAENQCHRSGLDKRI